MVSAVTMGSQQYSRRIECSIELCSHLLLYTYILTTMDSLTGHDQKIGADAKSRQALPSQSQDATV